MIINMFFLPGSSTENPLTPAAAPGLDGIETALLNLGPFLGRDVLPLDRTGIYGNFI